MRIAFFTHYFPKLSESFIINQVAGLMERGHDVTVFASEHPHEDLSHKIVAKHDMLDHTVYTKNPESYAEGLKIALESVAEIGAGCPGQLGKVRDAISVGKSAPGYLVNLATFLNYGETFDICHAHFGNIGRKWSFVDDLPDQTPLVTTFYAMDVSRFVHPGRYRWYEPFRSKRSLAIGISQYIRAQMITLGCPEERSIRHPIGIDIDAFEFDPTAFACEEPLRIASVARYVEQKGLKYGIEAVANCRERGLDVEFRVAGEGELRPDLELQIRDLGVEDSVHLIGWQTQEEVRELLGDAHLFMLPSVTA
jgi:colanic acid/amylovoran biosynthesis glycosyltransferase